MTRLKPWILPAVVPLLAFGAYVGLYAPLPISPGPDVCYYLLGVRHLEAGHWPWGGEPPLSFVFLRPFTAALGDSLGFVVLSATATAATVLLCGLLAAAAVNADRQGRPASRPTIAATLIAQTLALVYASPQYTNCLLKNSLANLLMCICLLAWFRPKVALRGAAVIAAVLACLAHPGAAASLGAAACICMLTSPIGPAGWLERIRTGLRRQEGRRLLGTLGLLAASGLAVAVVAWPTVARYAGTYLRAEGNAGRPFADWSLSTLVVRYLPLWAFLFWGTGAHLRRGRPSGRLLKLLWAWAFALAGLSVIGGAAGRRLEIQQFMPLSVLCAVYIGSAIGSGNTANVTCHRRVARGAAIALTAAIVFGLAILVPQVYPSDMPGAADLEALTAVGRALPRGGKLVTFATNTPYLAEYLTGLPVIGPWLLPERGLVSGPTYLLTEHSASGETPWSEDALHVLEEDGRVKLLCGRFLVLQANDDARFFARWPEEPFALPLELLGLDPARWPPVAVAEDPGGLWTRAFGWLVFAPSGLLILVGVHRALAAAAGLACSWLAWVWVVRRAASGRLRPAHSALRTGPEERKSVW